MMIPGILAQRRAAGGGVDPNVGVVWNPRSAAESNQWFGVGWSAALGIFAAVSSDGTNRVMTSPTGVSWTPRSAPAATWRSICWSPSLNMFVAVADTGSNQVMTSTDGETWVGRSAPAIGAFDVCWSPSLGRFVAIGYTAPYCIYSSDGINWTTSGTGLASGTWVGVSWSPELAIFVAVGYGGRVATSANGITWVTSTAPDKNWTRVVWGAEVSLFVATAQTEHVENIMTSANGITWELRNSGQPRQLFGVTYGNGLFVATISDAVADIPRIITSTHGVTWTPRGGAMVARYQDVVWSPYLSKFVGVAQTGTNRVMTSL